MARPSVDGNDQVRELELKLELTPDELQRVNANPALLSVTVGAIATQSIRSIYFDTPDQRLRRADISLRVRSYGDSWVQNVKCGTRLSNGDSHPVESESPLNSPETHLESIDDGKLRRKIIRLTEGSVLEAVFEVEVKRIVRLLRTEKGDLELALEEGVFRSGNVEAPLSEAELELKSGNPECLLETAAKLFGGTPLRFSGASKAERGYDLACGRTSSCGRPVQARSVELPADATCRLALEAFIQSAAEQIEANRSVILNSDDPEGPHQLRIGLRRLRSALRAFRPLIDLPSIGELNELTRSLANAIADLRNADVLISEIYAPVASLIKGHAGLAPLKVALHKHRLDKRDAARAALLGEQWSKLQLYLRLWPLTIENHKPLQRPVMEYADHALRKAWKNVEKRSENLSALTEEHRHEMRLALKRLRYTVEFFGSHYKPGDIRLFIKRLKVLQEILGYQNDVAQARQLEGIADRLCADSREGQRVAGYMLGWHTARAAASWEQAHTSWDRFQRTPRLWC